MSTNLNWIAFYEEYALKLLSYKDNLEELNSIIKELIVKNHMLHYLKLDEDNYIHDPFSLMSILNRPVSNKSRENMARVVAQQFKIKATVPTDYSMIPTTDTSAPIFHGNSECWKLFELAISCSKTNKFTQDYHNTFDTAIAVNGNNFDNITRTLSWIRPNSYLNLDATMIDFLTEYDNIVKIFPDILIAKKPSSEEYTNICIECLKLIDNGEFVCKNFVQMTSFIINEENTVKSYWWLNINDRTWDFVDCSNGERKIYSLANERDENKQIKQNFLDAKKSDIIVVYEASLIKRIIGFAKVVKSQNGDSKVFEKTKELKKPVIFDTFKEYKELNNMEFFTQNDCNLLKLTKDEYDFLLSITHEEEKPNLTDIVAQEIKKIKDNSTTEDTNIQELKETQPILVVEESEVEVQEIQEIKPAQPVQEVKPTQPAHNTKLDDIFISNETYQTITNILKLKKNLILQGGAGYGKSCIAKKIASSLATNQDTNFIELIQFHARYSYEDFLIGNELDKGIFYKFCKKAQNDLSNEYYFIIDEMQRGNINEIFGEVFMLIEKDKRNESSAISIINNPNEKFYVPANVNIIGIINTVDCGDIFDVALRRRFAFVDIIPAFYTPGFIKYQLSVNNEKYNKLILAVKEVNKVIKNDVNFGQDFQIGHSYFIEEDVSIINDLWIEILVKNQLIPLLDSYFHHNHIAKLLEDLSNKLLDAIK